ncbi:MAG: hypothetical protein WD844_07620 [Thermoleophilaceae bacterium]
MNSARRLALACCTVIAALAAPATAGALVQIDSAPLNIFLGAAGSQQARFDGATSGEFFSPSSDEPGAGFMMLVDVGETNADHKFANNFTPVDAGPVTGSGTQADPFSQVTFFSTVANPEQTADTILIRQTTTYVAGTSFYNLRWDITNQGDESTVIRPQLYADLYVSGSDSGVGFFESAPQAVVGGINQNAGASGGIVQITPWAKFEEDSFSIVSSHAQDRTGPGLDNSITGELVDNGVAVQFHDTPLAPGQTATFETAWRFTRFEGLAVDPLESNKPVGDVHTVRVTAQGNAGAPAAGVPIRYSISGVNPTDAEQSTVTGLDGSAEIRWRGRNPGTDTLSLTADLNGDGVAAGNEPQRTATVEFLAPQVARTAVVEPVSGAVFVRLPPGASPASYGLDAKSAQTTPGTPRGFIPLTGTATLPVRTIVNTNDGKIRLKSAAALSGSRTQAANFTFGTFQIIQKRARRPITEMVLKGGTFRGCPRTRARRSSGVDADDSQRRRRRTSRSRVRRLWGDGRGRFRTRGRYSSATVRGTKWIVEDRCGGTLTRLPRRPRNSRVDVRDNVRRKTIRLRAGRSYLARPRAARRR